MFRSPVTRPLPALAGILAGLASTLSLFLLPSPVPTHPDQTAFSADRAMTVLGTVAAEPHSIADPAAHARARDAVVAEFTALGLHPDVRSDPVTPQILNGRQVPAGLREHRLQNILVRIPGRSDRTMLLMAHYDSAFDDSRFPDELAPGPSSGVGDDGYGVATIIETVRALQADGRRPEHSLLILITDAEEAGLLGARSELAGHPEDYANVEWVLNLEARGTSGPALLFETSPDNAALVGHHLQAARGSVTTSLMPGLYRLMPNNTDLTPFLEAGFTGANIAAVGGGEHYHWATDDLAHAEPRTLQHYGDQVLASTRAWLFTPDAELSSAVDAHFFTLWRGYTMRYPEPVGVAAGGVALLAVTAALVVRRRRLRWAGVAGTVWGLTWRTLTVTVAAGVIQIGLSSAGLMPPFEAPFGPNPLLPWLYGAGALALLLTLGGYLSRRQGPGPSPGRDRGRGRGSGDDAWAAVLLLQACGSVLTLAFVPGASYLAVWPLLALTAAWTARGAAATRAASALAAAFVVTALFGPMVVLIHQAMSVTLVTASLLFAAFPVAPLILLLGVGAPAADRLTPGRAAAAADRRRRPCPATPGTTPADPVTHPGPGSPGGSAPRSAG